VIWIIDPERRVIVEYRLLEDGSYSFPKQVENGEIEGLIGIKISLEEIFRT